MGTSSKTSPLQSPAILEPRLPGPRRSRIPLRTWLCGLDYRTERPISDERPAGHSLQSAATSSAPSSRRKRPWTKELEQGSLMKFQSQWSGQSLYFPCRGAYRLRAKQIGKIIPTPFSSVNLEWVYPVGDRTKQQPSLAQQSRHLLHAESPCFFVHHVLQHE